MAKSPNRMIIPGLYTSPDNIACVTHMGRAHVRIYLASGQWHEVKYDRPDEAQDAAETIAASLPDLVPLPWAGGVRRGAVQSIQVLAESVMITFYGHARPFGHRFQSAEEATAAVCSLVEAFDRRAVEDAS